MFERYNPVACFFIGLGTGVGLGLLLAPRSGSDTRRLVRENVQEGTGYITSRMQAGRDQLADRARGVKDSTNRFVGAVGAGAKAFRQRVG